MDSNQAQLTSSYALVALGLSKQSSPLMMLQLMTNLETQFPFLVIPSPSVHSLTTMMGSNQVQLTSSAAQAPLGLSRQNSRLMMLQLVTDLETQSQFQVILSLSVHLETMTVDFSQGQLTSSAGLAALGLNEQNSPLMILLLKTSLELQSPFLEIPSPSVHPLTMMMDPNQVVSILTDLLLNPIQSYSVLTTQI